MLTVFGKKIIISLVLGLLVCASGLGYFLMQNQRVTVGIESNSDSAPISDGEQSSIATTTDAMVSSFETTEIIDQNKAEIVSDSPKESVVPVEKINQKISENNSPELKEENETNTRINDMEESERFVVATEDGEIGRIADALLEQGFIKDRDAFIKGFAAKNGERVNPGGYKLSKNMDLEQISTILREKPYMKWVVIPEGLRKEEIAQLLASALGWSQVQKDKWINTYTAMKFDYIEGVYFPDTYLIPVEEDPLKVAERLQTKFNEKFALYLPEFNQQNIKWTTGLTFASIVQREAANKADMPLIAGILWNRLEQNMALNVDATLQYVRGDTGNGWWAPLKLADKQTESPYNTYLNKGLPPHPICNPGIIAIEATLNPAETDCLYYLHDKNHITHCSKTYEEHQENIEKYLKAES